MIDRLLEMAEEAREEIVALARDLVQLETVNTGVMPTGGETAAAEFLRDLLRRNGIEETALLARDPARANLVARLPGESDRAQLLLLGHTDVVPAGDAGRWRHPPFAGQVEDGRLYGRGAADMKGTVAAEVMAVILLKRAGARLRHTVTLACVADEEAGGAYGMGWLARCHPDRLRAEVCLNEGGGRFVTLGDELCCVVGLGEKGRHEATFEVGGRGAHAAQPWWGENAFFHLARLLARIEGYEPERRVEAPLFAALRDRMDAAEFPDREVTSSNVDRFAEAIGRLDKSLGSACRGLSRLTVVPSLVAGGVKSNSVPERASLRCDVRSLPSQDRAYLEAELHRLAEEVPEVRIELETTAPASESPPDPAVLGALKEALAQSLGREVTLLPGLNNGFTDSRFAREIGIPAYGFTPGRPELGGETRNVHGTDEWTAVKDLVALTQFFLAAALRLDRLVLGN